MAKMSKEEWRREWQRREIERLRRETQSPRSFSGPTTPKQDPMDTTPKSLNSGRSYDPRYFVTPDEYQDGNLPQGGFALASGGTAIADALRLAKKVRRNKYAGGGNPTDPVVGTNPATAAPNPQTQQPLLNGNQSYINSLYKNIMGREADTAGQQYWMDQLNSGALNQGQVLQNFAGSQEFQNLYKTDPTKAITALYDEALGRAPDQGGLQYWQDQAQQGLALPTMTENFLNSAEGQNVYAISQAYQDATGNVPTDDQIVQAQQALASGQDLNSVIDSVYNTPTATSYLANNLYQNYTGTQATPDQIKEFQAQLEQGIDPSEIANQIQSSDAANAYQDTQFIKDEYQGLYGRDPKDEELKAALDQLSKGVSYDQLDKSLGESEESQLYQASNFEPYDVASNGKTPRPHQARTTYQQLKQVYDNLRNNGIPDILQPLVNAISKGEGGPNSINNGTVRGKIIGATNDASKVLGKPLDQHTVGEVMKLQQGTPATGRKIFASGKLQMIPSTLKSVAKLLGLDPNTLYDEATQIRLGLIAGLQKPALLKVLAGKSDNLDAAAKALAEVWASFPSPKTGKSLYGSGNKSSHTVAEVKDLLRKARGSVSFAPPGKDGGTTPVGKEPPEPPEQPAPGGGDGGVAPQPGMSPYDPVTEQFYKDQGIGVPQQGDVILSPLTPVGGGDSYGGGKGLAPAEGGGQGAYNDTGGSFDVADSGGGYYDPIGGLIGGGWGGAGEAQGPSADYGWSSWGPWSEDYYRYMPDMLGLKRGGRVARGLEIAKRASGGNLVKDALRIADRKRQNDAIGSVEPMPDYMRPYNELPPKKRAEISEHYWRSATPKSGPSATTPRSSSETTPKVSPEEYRRGNLGDGDFALANGGIAKRRGYALGGNPTNPVAGTNPATGTSAFTNPYASYVSSLYNNILGRQADTGGQQYWENQLNTGATTTQDMLNNFAASQEYQNLYKTDPTKAVSGMYQAALGRTPEQAGLEYWTGQAKQGLDANKLASSFAGAPEFQNRNAIFNSYLNYTGEAPKPEQYASAAQALASGKTLNDVEQQIASSPQANANFVRSAYQGLLGQIPDQSQINTLTNQLNSGELTQQNLLNMLASSSQGAEYANEQTLLNAFKGAMNRAPTQAEQDYYLPQMAQNKITQDQLFQAVRNTPEAQDYSNTRLVKDTFKALTGQTPDQATIQKYVDQITSGELDSGKLWTQLEATPESQKWAANTPKGSFDDVIGRFGQAAKDLTGLGKEAATKVGGLWDQIVQINPDLAGSLTSLIGLESGRGGLTAQAGKSSAAGLGQQTTAYVTEQINKLFGTNYNTSNLPADIRKAITSTDPSSQALSLASFLQGTLTNAQNLQKNGIPVNEKTLYALHNLGPGGGMAFLNALERNPNATMGSIAKALGGGSYSQGMAAIRGNSKLYPQGASTKIGDAFDNFSRLLDPKQTPEHQEWGTNVINQLGEIADKAKPSPTTPVTPPGETTPQPPKPGDQSNLENYNKAFTQYKKDLGMYWFEQQAQYNAAKSYSYGNLDWNSWSALAEKGAPKPPDPTKYGFSFNPEINSWTYPAPTSTGGNAGQGLAGQGAGGNVAGNTGIGATGGVQPLVIPGITGNADLAKSLEQRSIEQQADYLAKGQALALGLAQQGQAVAEGAIAAGRTALQNYLTQTGSAGLSYLMGFGPPPTNAYGSVIIPPSGFGPGYGGGGGGGYGGTGSVTTAGGGGGTSVGSGGYSIGYMNKGGPVWDKSRPKSLGKPKHLSSKQKASAKAAAKAAGRPYPNLVDNMRAAQKSHGGPLSKAMNLTRRILDE